MKECGRKLLGIFLSGAFGLSFWVLAMQEVSSFSSMLFIGAYSVVITFLSIVIMAFILRLFRLL